MKHTYTVLFLLCAVYMLLSSLSAFLAPPLGDLIFTPLAIAVALFLAANNRQCRLAPVDTDISLRPQGVLRSLWLLPPFIAAVAGVSLLCSAVAALVNYPVPTVSAEDLPLTLLCSALLPAVCEELLCRHLFLRRLTPYSRSGGILASALFFSILHMHFVQMPYAFVAGLLLGALAVVTGSVVPCILFHFVNNAFSILLTRFAGTAVSLWLHGGLGVCLLLSLVYAVFARRRISRELSPLFSRDTTVLDSTVRDTVLGMLRSPLSLLLGGCLILACFRS